MQLRDAIRPFRSVILLADQILRALVYKIDQSKNILGNIYMRIKYHLVSVQRKHNICNTHTYTQYDIPEILPQTSNDSHAYECLSSSPECDSNLELRHGGGVYRTPCKRKSDSSAMGGDPEMKLHHQPFVRSTSLPYCGSETESELYAPYTFYAGDEVCIICFI